LISSFNLPNLKRIQQIYKRIYHIVWVRISQLVYARLDE